MRLFEQVAVIDASEAAVFDYLSFYTSLVFTRLEYGKLMQNVISRFADKKGFHFGGQTDSLTLDFLATYFMCLKIFESLEGIEHETL